MDQDKKRWLVEKFSNESEIEFFNVIKQHELFSDVYLTWTAWSDFFDIAQTGTMNASIDVDQNFRDIVKTAYKPFLSKDNWIRIFTAETSLYQAQFQGLFSILSCTFVRQYQVLMFVLNSLKSLLLSQSTKVSESVKRQLQAFKIANETMRKEFDYDGYVKAIGNDPSYKDATEIFGNQFLKYEKMHAIESTIFKKLHPDIKVRDQKFKTAYNKVLLEIKSTTLEKPTTVSEKSETIARTAQINMNINVEPILPKNFTIKKIAELYLSIDSRFSSMKSLQIFINYVYNLEKALQQKEKSYEHSSDKDLIAISECYLRNSLVPFFYHPSGLVQLVQNIFHLSEFILLSLTFPFDDYAVKLKEIIPISQYEKSERLADVFDFTKRIFIYYANFVLFLFDKNGGIFDYVPAVNFADINLSFRKEKTSSTIVTGHYSLFETCSLDFFKTTSMATFLRTFDLNLSVAFQKIDDHSGKELHNLKNVTINLESEPNLKYDFDSVQQRFLGFVNFTKENSFNSDEFLFTLKQGDPLSEFYKRYITPSEEDYENPKKLFKTRLIPHQDVFGQSFLIDFFGVQFTDWDTFYMEFSVTNYQLPLDVVVFVPIDDFETKMEMLDEKAQDMEKLAKMEQQLSKLLSRKQEFLDQHTESKKTPIEIELLNSILRLEEDILALKKKLGLETSKQKEARVNFVIEDNDEQIFETGRLTPNRNLPRVHINVPNSENPEDPFKEALLPLEQDKKALTINDQGFQQKNDENAPSNPEISTEAEIPLNVVEIDKFLTFDSSKTPLTPRSEAIVNEKNFFLMFYEKRIKPRLAKKFQEANQKVAWEGNNIKERAIIIQQQTLNETLPSIFVEHKNYVDLMNTLEKQQKHKTMFDEIIRMLKPFEILWEKSQTYAETFCVVKTEYNNECDQLTDSAKLQFIHDLRTHNFQMALNVFASTYMGIPEFFPTTRPSISNYLPHKSKSDY